MGPTIKSYPSLSLASLQTLVALLSYNEDVWGPIKNCGALELCTFGMKVIFDFIQTRPSPGWVAVPIAIDRST